MEIIDGFPHSLSALLVCRLNSIQFPCDQNEWLNELIEMHFLLIVGIQIWNVIIWLTFPLSMTWTKTEISPSRILRTFFNSRYVFPLGLCDNPGLQDIPE